MVRIYFFSILLVFSTFFFTNCSRDAIEGAGAIIIENRLGLRNFDGVILESDCEVRLVQDNQFRVEVGQRTIFSSDSMRPLSAIH